MVDIVCETCRKVFTVKRRKDRAPSRFCSLTCRGIGRHDETELDEARRLRADGVAWTSIAKRLGRSKEYYRYQLDDEYAERRGARKRAKKIGAMAHWSKPIRTSADLSDAIIAEIKEKHALGIRLTSIPAVLSVKGIPHRAVAGVIKETA